MFGPSGVLPRVLPFTQFYPGFTQLPRVKLSRGFTHQHWSYMHRRILKVWHHIKSVTPSIDAYLLKEQLCQISSQSDLRWLGVHQSQKFAIRPDPDPCWILACQIRPDTNWISITWIWPDPDPNLTHIGYCQQQEKNYSFCTTTGRNWNDCLPCFVTELLLEW